MLMEHLTSRDWQAGRNRFNHDWLKNKFLLSLERLVKIAQDKIEDEDYANRFLAEGLQAWQVERLTASELIDSFEAAMSPRTYLDREPLSRSKDREWLRQVIHGLWLSRVGVNGLQETARTKLAEASAAYVKFCECIDGQCGKMDCARLACCRSELIEFRDKCRELATAFETFPHRILVT